VSERANYGIVGNVAAQNLAVGENARVEIAGADHRIAEQLATLLSEIAAFDGDDERRSALAAAGDEITNELQQPAKDRRRVLAGLETIASLAGPAGAIGSAATALMNAVRAIL
jgi:hypothetical protein